MSASLSPFEAYRRDLERASANASIEQQAHLWLPLAHILWRLTDAPSGPDGWAARLRALTDEMDAARDEDDPSSAFASPQYARLRTCMRLASDGSSDELIGEVLRDAAEMEDAGAFDLANTVLGSLRALGAGASPLARGRVLAQQARVTRQLGDFDVAADLYEQVGRLGEDAREPELTARAEIGRGILARFRGNFPAARRHFGGAIESAARAGRADLQCLAHQGLMVAAGAASDFDAALREGWAALQLCGDDPVRHAELLTSLAAVCHETGRHRAARSAYLQAGSATNIPRVRLLALAGAARATARLGDRAELETLTERVRDGLKSTAMPYERAQLLKVLAEAWIDIEPESVAMGFLTQGMELARTHGFFEYAHSFEALQAHTRERHAAPRLTPASTSIIQAIETLREGGEAGGVGAVELSRADR